MAETRVNTPDGQVITVVHPEGASEQQILRFAQQQHQPQQPVLPVPPDRPSRSVFSEVDPAFGLGEAVTNFASGLPASAAAGLTGLLSFSSGRDDAFSDALDTAADVTNRVSNNLTFQPRTGFGLSFKDSISKPFEAFERSADLAGESILNATGSPAAATATKTALLGAPSVLGFRRGKPTRRQQKAKTAQDNGFVVEPDTATAGVGGVIKIRQEASFRNQQNTNRLVRKELGIPDDVPITPEMLSQIRRREAATYNELRSQGEIPLSEAYKRANKQAVKDLRALEVELEGVTKAKDLFKRNDQLAKKGSVNADSGVSLIQIFRENADRAFKKKKNKEGTAWRDMANALEDAFAAELRRRGEFALVENFKGSRQNIAKTYSVEKALAGEDVSATKLATSKDPLSGTLREIADFGREFPKVARVIKDSPTNFSPLDAANIGLSIPLAAGGSVVAPGIGTLAGIAPGLISALRPVLRSRALSKGGQRAVVRPGLRPETIGPGLLGSSEAAREGLLSR